MPISGRFFTAAMNLARLPARYSGVPPLRSWSMKEKPDPVPRPGMGGGPKAKAVASGISRANSALRARMTSKTRCSFALRSSQGFMETKKKPVLEA